MIGCNSLISGSSTSCPMAAAKSKTWKLPPPITEARTRPARSRRGSHAFEASVVASVAAPAAPVALRSIHGSRRSYSNDVGGAPASGTAVGVHGTSGRLSRNRDAVRGRVRRPTVLRVCTHRIWAEDARLLSIAVGAWLCDGEGLRPPQGAPVSHPVQAGVPRHPRTG